MKVLKVLIFVFAFIIALPGFSQDLIYKINGEVISCEISSVDAQFINYTKNRYSGSKMFSILKSQVTKIVYESAKIDSTLAYNPVQEINLEKSLQSQNRNIFKMGVFSPLAGALSIGYERSLKPTRSYEAFIGFIGAGTDINENAIGAYGRLGYKLYRNPKYYQQAGDDAHLMHGFFIMPTIMVSYFAYDDWSYSSSSWNGNKIRNDAYSVAVILNMGKQWIWGDEFSLQINVGAGYAISSDDYYYYSHVSYGNDFPLALSCGVSFGFLN